MPAGDDVTHKTIHLASQLPPATALERVTALLSAEGVEYTATDLSVASTRTPIAVLGIQPKLYSRRNWVGLNPFAFVTDVQVRCEQEADRNTRVTIQVGRRRAILWVAFWGAAFSLSAQRLPALAIVAVATVAVGCAWLVFVSFLGGYLVKREILGVLESR
jgi:hypothetical protein